MKLNTENESQPTLESEGKLLEIIPIIEEPSGQPSMLPPVVYHVPNWLLGFRDDHPISMPIQIYFGSRTDIPGSASARNHRLLFLVRIMEASPSYGVEIATVDENAVVALIEAIRTSVVEYRSR